MRNLRLIYKGLGDEGVFERVEEVCAEVQEVPGDERGV